METDRVTDRQEDRQRAREKERISRWKIFEQINKQIYDIIT